jgi:hypothetical protein
MKEFAVTRMKEKECVSSTNVITQYNDKEENSVPEGYRNNMRYSWEVFCSRHKKCYGRMEMAFT